MDSDSPIQDGESARRRTNSETTEDDDGIDVLTQSYELVPETDDINSFGFLSSSTSSLVSPGSTSQSTASSSSPVSNSNSNALIDVSRTDLEAVTRSNQSSFAQSINDDSVNVPNEDEGMTDKTQEESSPKTTREGDEENEIAITVTPSQDIGEEEQGDHRKSSDLSPNTSPSFGIDGANDIAVDHTVPILENDMVILVRKLRASVHSYSEVLVERIRHLQLPDIQIDDRKVLIILLSAIVVLLAFWTGYFIACASTRNENQPEQIHLEMVKLTNKIHEDLMQKVSQLEERRMNELKEIRLALDERIEKSHTKLMDEIVQTMKETRSKAESSSKESKFRRGGLKREANVLDEDENAADHHLENDFAKFVESHAGADADEDVNLRMKYHKWQNRDNRDQPFEEDSQRYSEDDEPRLKKNSERSFKERQHAYEPRWEERNFYNDEDHDRRQRKSNYYQYQENNNKEHRENPRPREQQKYQYQEWRDPWKTWCIPYPDLNWFGSTAHEAATKMWEKGTNFIDRAAKWTANKVHEFQGHGGSGRRTCHGNGL